MQNDSAFSFCEQAAATGGSPWHIRKLSSAGRKLGGGADTRSLCGREVCWDLEVRITAHHLMHCCPQCASEFERTIFALDRGSGQ